VLFVERSQVEYLSQQGPGKWQIGDQYGRRGFSDVPEYPCPQIRVCEAIVFVQDRGENDKDTEAEDAAEDQFTLQWEEGPKEEREGDAEHDEIG
jgi:hypothetical protein